MPPGQQPQQGGNAGGHPMPPYPYPPFMGGWPPHPSSSGGPMPPGYGYGYSQPMQPPPQSAQGAPPPSPYGPPPPSDGGSLPPSSMMGGPPPPGPAAASSHHPQSQGHQHGSSQPPPAAGSWGGGAGGAFANRAQHAQGKGEDELRKLKKENADLKSAIHQAKRAEGSGSGTVKHAQEIARLKAHHAAELDKRQREYATAMRVARKKADIGDDDKVYMAAVDEAVTKAKQHAEALEVDLQLLRESEPERPPSADGATQTLPDLTLRRNAELEEEVTRYRGKADGHSARVGELGQQLREEQGRARDQAATRVQGLQGDEAAARATAASLALDGLSALLEAADFAGKNAKKAFNRGQSLAQPGAAAGNQPVRRVSATNGVQPRCFGVTTKPPRPQGNKVYSVLLDLDGTILNTFFDDPYVQTDYGDVFSMDLRSGLRMCIEKIVSLKPKLELGIFTAAQPCYCEGARKLISELVCGMEVDPFDFAIACDRNDRGSEQRISKQKDLGILGRPKQGLLLFDNDPRVVHPDYKRNTVVTPDYCYDPKARDPTLIQIAELVTRIVATGKPVSDALNEIARQPASQRLVYLSGDYYYIQRRCAKCDKAETLHPDASQRQELVFEMTSYDLLCPECWRAIPANSNLKCRNYKGSRRGGPPPLGLQVPWSAPTGTPTHTALRTRPKQLGEDAEVAARPAPVKPQQSKPAQKPAPKPAGKPAAKPVPKSAGRQSTASSQSSLEEA
eukprot:Hpha_TRINITY_DN14582_c1_g3::TRINITY_DN14582_c1_g3_i1::g.46966::m.46966